MPGFVNPQSWNRYSYAYNNPINYVDWDGHNPVAILIAAGVIILKIIDYGWTGYDAYNYVMTAVDPNNTPEIQNEAWGNAAATIGMELIEPDDVSPVSLPIDDIVRHYGDDALEYIYKKGSDTVDNLTPRPQDAVKDGGLSFWDSLESLKKNMGLEPKDKITVVDPNKIDGLNVIRDNVPEGHVTVRPDNLEDLKDWSSTRKTGRTWENAHPLSKILNDAKVWAGKVKNWLKDNY